MKTGKRMRLLTLLIFAHTTAGSGFAAMELPAGAQSLANAQPIEGTPRVHKFRLANGLKVLILSDSRNPVATLRVKLDAGSNREKLGTTGLAHFFEHMMFRKTQVTSEGHYDRVLAGVGGRGNAATSTDYVVYESTFPGPALDKILELEAQRFKLLDLQDPFFTTEKGAVISERKLRYENDPTQRGMEILRRVIYRGTPYEWFTIGAKKTSSKCQLMRHVASTETSTHPTTHSSFLVAPSILRLLSKRSMRLSATGAVSLKSNPKGHLIVPSESLLAKSLSVAKMCLRKCTVSYSRQLKIHTHQRS